MGRFLEDGSAVPSINIIKEEELNSYYDERRTRNGGGYHQPQYTFEYGEWTGTFTDTSCGDFGTRYTLGMTNGSKTYRAGWGTMYDSWNSNFPDEFPESGFYQEFKKVFEERIPTESVVD